MYSVRRITILLALLCATFVFVFHSVQFYFHADAFHTTNFCSSYEVSAAFSNSFGTALNESVIPTPDLDKPITSSHAKEVLVFLHIQKTAGTLIERRFTRGGLTDRQCVCPKGRFRCNCTTADGHTWLLSRFSTGWICGLHADLTEYLECANSALNKADGQVVPRRLVYFTMLRDPLDRFLSEWLHVRRGGTWRRARLRCHGHSPPSRHYRPCYTIPEFMSSAPKPLSASSQLSWLHVSLDKFLHCPYNLALNRQTRMLANLSALGCYEHLVDWATPLHPSKSLPTISSAQAALRISAKHMLLLLLKSISLSEHLVYSQYHLQRALNITLNILLSGDRLSFTNSSGPRHVTHTELVRPTLSASEVQAVEDYNHLDVNVYRFAKRLMACRLSTYLLHDFHVPYPFKRPLLTLYRGNIWRRCHSLTGLLLDCGDKHCFTRRLVRSVQRILIHQGSSPVPVEHFLGQQEKRGVMMRRNFLLSATNVSSIR
ncbi:unnamed protein product [Calicophoron daubneyi]|uniref:Heparan-sulfate 6-O-sulfotransferase n=1 Tax=Calicophoron daubneyi TaxID=300641 RepID=A0AAV2TXH6_CALDB